MKMHGVRKPFIIAGAATLLLAIVVVGTNLPTFQRLLVGAEGAARAAFGGSAAGEPFESLEILPVPADVENLPDIEGMGYVPSLHQRMVRDETGQLKHLVEQFVAEPDRVVRMALADEVLHAWTGEADNLKAIEALQGAPYTGPVHENAMRVIDSGFDSLVMLVYQFLMQDSHLAQYYESARYDIDGRLTLEHVAATMQEEIAADAGKGEESLLDFLSNVGVVCKLDRVDIQGFRDILAAENPRYGTVVDAVYGEMVFMEAGESTVMGGTNALGISEMPDIPDESMFFMIKDGSCAVDGGVLDDTYLFSPLSGIASINDPAGDVTILLWEGVSPEDVAVERVSPEGSSEDADVRIAFAGSEGEIVLKRFSFARACTIVFADGSTASIQDYS